MKHKEIVASWSGGIDSTAVLGQLAQRGYKIRAVVLDIYRHKMPIFSAREGAARKLLAPIINDLAKQNGGGLEVVSYSDASWIWAFSRDTVEIPRRNKYILDFMIEREAIPAGITNIGMGEYTGADTWLVREHVAASDADHRSLAAYLYLEYGINWRLITLQDFGESRYKSDRLKLGFDALGEWMIMTTNCLSDAETHCGKCYKCIERHAAFRTIHAEDGLIVDETEYATPPADQPRYELYMRQMQGEEVTASADLH
jgi:hypothetical protein